MAFHYLSSIILLLILTYCAFEDLKSSSLPLSAIILFAAGGILIQLIFRQTDLLSLICGCGAGGLLVVLAYLSGGSFGCGDALMFIVTGIYLGFKSNIMLILVSLLLSAAASLLLMAALKLRAKSQVPFMPFVLGGYITMLAVNIL